VRITSLSGAGMLSFDQFRLGLSERVTFVVGSNGAGKSNLTRLLTVCLRAVESADGAAGDVDRMLAAFLAARHVDSKSSATEVRVGVRLTDAVGRNLVTEFVRAMVTGAMTARRLVMNMAEIDVWAEAEITEDKLQPLMEGEIIVNHAGTADGRWYCAYEFTAPGHDQAKHKYRWILLGLQSGVIFVADTPVIGQGSDIATRITGASTPEPGPAIPVPGGFQLLDLLPMPELPTLSCTFELSGMPSGSQRQFAQMTGLPLISPDGSRTVNLATVLRFIFGRALV
jgi:energy-coupling factor transporter ATP-binding protein EcfA2